MRAPVRDPQVIRARREMAAAIPYGWSWAVSRDAYGVVCAAWRQGPPYPEPVRLEARSAGELADEIALYLDGLQAALEIASGTGGRLLEAGHGVESCLMSGPRCPVCLGSGRDSSGRRCEACVGSGRIDPGQAAFSVPAAEPRQLGLFPAEVYRPPRRWRDAA